MSVVQTTYPNYHEGLVEGQIVDTQTCDTDSLANVGDDPIPFGRAVRQASASGSGPRDCELGVASNVFRGVAVQDGVTIATVQNPTLRAAGPEAIRQCPT